MIIETSQQCVVVCKEQNIGEVKKDARHFEAWILPPIACAAVEKAFKDSATQRVVQWMISLLDLIDLIQTKYLTNCCMGYHWILFRHAHAPQDELH